MSSRFILALTKAFTDACSKVQVSDPNVHIVVDRPKDRKMGDFSCSVAMQLAGSLGQSPKSIAEQIKEAWVAPSFVESAEVVGGYINVRVHSWAKTAVVGKILSDLDNFGRGKGKGKHVLLEFVSANPTGPLHIGHGRAAAYGDSLARILRYAGWSVETEYYVNDAGRQVDILTASVWLRHLRQAINWDDMPPGSYRGRYLAEVAQSLKEWMIEHGRKRDVSRRRAADVLVELRGESNEEKAAEILICRAREVWKEDFDELRKLTCDEFVKKIEADLKEMGVAFDSWFKEYERLHMAGKIELALKKLRQKSPNSIYDKDGALWFRASDYGDEEDRVVRRRNGVYTYFAADIAYHDEKFRRITPAGIPIRLINVLGADHHGYVPRLKAVMQALGHDPNLLEVELIQFVALVRNKVRVKMSTRAGDFVSLRDLLDDVGKDAARFFFVSRNNNQHMDFDLDIAVQQNSKNPVYYSQYACARAEAILQKYNTKGNSPSSLVSQLVEDLGGEDEAAIRSKLAEALDGEDEIAMCDMLGNFGDVVERAADARAPHLLANWLSELSMMFHSYYEKVKVLSIPDSKQRAARVALLLAVKIVVARGLNLLGVEVPSEM